MNVPTGWGDLDDAGAGCNAFESPAEAMEEYSDFMAEQFDRAAEEGLVEDDGNHRHLLVLHHEHAA